MSRRCQITGVGPSSGHNVSHANNKTKRRFLPNLHPCLVLDARSGKYVRLKITTRAMRTMMRTGFSGVLVKHEV